MRILIGVGAATASTDRICERFTLATVGTDDCDRSRYVRILEPNRLVCVDFLKSLFGDFFDTPIERPQPIYGVCLTHRIRCLSLAVNTILEVSINSLVGNEAVTE